MMSSHVIAISRAHLKFSKELGKGGFSTVYQVTYLVSRTRQPRYAAEAASRAPCKEWLVGHSRNRQKREYGRETFRIPAAAKKLNKVDRKELELLSRLKHPHIVKLYGVVDELPDFYLVLELCEGGSLRSYLNKHKATPLHPCLAYSWGEQGARAVEYLHQEKVIHRDLKADNFLISKTKNLKLCDFGISKNADKTVTTCVKGTWGWTAPENFSEEHESPLSDLYALACVIWELVSRKIPFEGCEYQNIMYRVCKKGERPEIPEDCPAVIAELMRKCWNANRRSRPTIGQVVQVMCKFREETQCECHAKGEVLHDVLPYTCAKIEVFYCDPIRDEELTRLDRMLNRESEDIPAHIDDLLNLDPIRDEELTRLDRMLNRESEDIPAHIDDLLNLDSDEGDLTVQEPFQLHSILKRWTEFRERGRHKQSQKKPQGVLMIYHGMTVAQIKNMIDKDHPGKLHVFTSPEKDTELTDDQTLLDYKMSGEKTTLYLKIDCEAIIEYDGGDNLSVGISQRDDITAIKSKIHGKVGIQPEAQQLFHEGKTLHNSDNVSQFLDKAFQMTFHLKCHDKISVLVKRISFLEERRGKISRGQICQNPDQLRRAFAMGKDKSHKGLKENCARAGLCYRGKTLGNGDCFFKAVADQLERIQTHPVQSALELRHRVVEFMQKNRSFQISQHVNIRTFLDENLHDFCQRMKRQGEWADQVVVFAMAAMLQIHIYIVTSKPIGSEIGVLIRGSQGEHEATPQNTILLGYRWENHYQSLQLTELATRQPSVDTPIRLPIYPSQTFEDMVAILARDHTLSFKHEALLFQGQVLFTRMARASLNCDKLQLMLLEADVENESIFYVEEPIQVCTCDFNLETGHMITSVDDVYEEQHLYGSQRGHFGSRLVDVLLVFPSQTIEDVKNRLNQPGYSHSHAVEGPTDRSYQTRLRFHGTILEDSNPISHYDICHGSKIVVEQQLQVCLCVEDKKASKAITVAWESDTIAQVKIAAGIEPTKNYIMLDTKLLIRETSRSSPRQKFYHDRHEYDDEDTCSVIKARSDGKATLFLLDPNHVMRIHVQVELVDDGLGYGDLIGDYTATVTPSIAVQDLTHTILGKILPHRLGHYSQSIHYDIEGSALFQDYTGRREEELAIYLNQQELDNDKTLSFYDITDEFPLMIKWRSAKEDSD